MSKLRIAVGGLGTVGSSLIELLMDSADVEVVAVSARSKGRDRPVNITPYEWFDDPVAMARSEGNDIFVELMGGSDGVAKASVEAALEAGKPVVTANKALIATHGLALAKLAEDKGAALRYEAAVAGGVPIIRALRDGLAPTNITAIKGVLNGTCNFMLAEMEKGRSYDDALEEAQRIGFAEADPTMDVGGIDAAQKLAILSALAFGVLPSLDEMDITGIDVLSTEDIAAALDLGLVTKLVAEATCKDGGIAFDVGPALVPETDPLDIGSGGENIIIADAIPLGRVALSGPGAGGGATASAVAADINTIARGSTGPVFARPASELSGEAPKASGHDRNLFIRATVADGPGILAELTQALGKEKISVETIRQRPSTAPELEGFIEVVITTAPAPRGIIRQLSDTLSNLSVVRERASVYPILEEVSA